MTETCFTGKSCLLSYRGLEVLHPIYKPTASRCSFCNYLVSARCYIASIKSYRKHCLFHSFSHNHTRTLCFIPLTPLFPFSCPTYTASTFPTRTLTIFTTEFNSILSLHRHTQHCTSSLPLLPHQSPIPHINRTGIPIPVKNNESLLCLGRFVP